MSFAFVLVIPYLCLHTTQFTESKAKMLSEPRRVTRIKDGEMEELAASHLDYPKVTIFLGSAMPLNYHPCVLVKVYF
jgi:hypothetical protein